MNQNDTNKKLNELSDDFLGQVSGGRQNFSLEEQQALKDAIERENNRGGNFDLNEKVFSGGTATNFTK